MVTASECVPQRGDAVWIDFTPQAGRRPAVVLSPQSYNGSTGLAILCQITSHVKGYPFEVAIPAGLGVKGVILADQVRSMDWRARHATLITALPVNLLDAAMARVWTLFAKEED